MEFMASSPSTGVGMSNMGPEEVINGWHSSATSHSIPTSSSVVERERKGKGKEVNDVLQRTPRRMAAHKAMEQAMRSSAPPSSPRASRSDVKRGKEQSATTSSPMMKASSVAGASSSSSSSTLQDSSLLNGSKNQRRATSSSPFSPLHKAPSPSPNSLQQTAPVEQQPESSIDAAEREQFHFLAAPNDKTAILPRPPPSLPYDSSYIPLSPNGVDQVGHALAPPSMSTASETATGKGPLEVGKVGKGNHQTGPPKKVLPGQELENHVISDVSGQKAMPWGLQATLMEKQMGGKRGRTKMGSLKRTT